MILIPILLPFLGAIPVFFMHQRRSRSIYIAVLLAVEVCALLSLDWAQAPMRLFSMNGDIVLSLGTDTLGKFFALLVSVIWFIVGIFAFDYMEHEENRARFFGFYVMALGALIGICLSANLVTRTAFHEFSGHSALCTDPFIIAYDRCIANRTFQCHIPYNVWN